MRAMNSNGLILDLSSNEKRDELVEELDLIEIPREEAPEVLNFSDKSKIAWYNERHTSVAA